MSHATRIAASPTEGFGRELDGIRVLVVDDMPDSAELATVMLRVFGARVESARSCADALARFGATDWPDVVVCDLLEPSTEGTAFAHAVRRTLAMTGARVKLLALTDGAADGALVSTTPRGFDESLTKPLDPTVLADAVGRLSGRSFR